MFGGTVTHEIEANACRFSDSGNNRYTLGEIHEAIELALRTEEIKIRDQREISED